MSSDIEIVVNDCYASFKNLYGEPTDNAKLKEALEKSKKIEELSETDIIPLSNNCVYSLTINNGVRFQLPSITQNYSEIVVFLNSKTQDTINFGTNIFMNKEYPMTSVGNYIVKYISNLDNWICEIKEFGEV